MAKFRVGQKARVKSIRYADPRSVWRVGAEVTIVAVGYGLHHWIDGSLGSHECIVQCSDGALAWPMFDQLEPIQPEGNKVVEWSKCLWNPEHLKEKVQ